MSTEGEYPIGHEIKLVLKSKREISGVIFAHDAANNRLILETMGAQEDTIFVNLVSVLSKTVSPAPVATAGEEKLFALTPELASRREKQAFQAREAALMKSSSKSHGSGGVVGVSPLGKELYNALSKTYECRWRANMVLEVVVLDVFVKPPYRHNDVSGMDNRAVIRVKELLGKIQLKH